jgi:hypothetical protein
VRPDREGVAIAPRKNPHIGSHFDSWLDEAGIREEVTAAAIKAMIAPRIMECRINSAAAGGSRAGSFSARFRCAS